MQVKAIVSKAIAASDSLIRRIKSGASEYDWANTDKVLGGLTAKWNDFDAVMNDFSRDFLLQQVSTIKTTYQQNIADYINHLRTFSLLKPKAIDLQKSADRILSMHQQHMR